MTPHVEEVISSEQVQLPFYAMLSGERIRQVENLRLAGRDFGSPAILKDDTLQCLIDGNGQRLRAIMSQLTKGASLPA